MLKDKVRKLAGLRAAVRRLRKQGKKIVFTNGCFDILHLGHARYLEEARRLGDILVVAVNNDASVRRIKGPQRPIVPEGERAGLLAALECVDLVVLFAEDTPLKAIEALCPDVLVKGADWKKDDIVGAEFVRAHGGKVATVKLVKGLSTTSIINNIKHTRRCC